MTRFKESTIIQEHWFVQMFTFIFINIHNQALKFAYFYLNYWIYSEWNLSFIYLNIKTTKIEIIVICNLKVNILKDSCRSYQILAHTAFIRAVVTLLIPNRSYFRYRWLATLVSLYAPIWFWKAIGGVLSSEKVILIAAV